MKNKNILWIVLTLTAFCFMGCSLTKKKADPTPVRYSFAEAGSSTAAIIFVEEKKKGVILVDCEGASRPAPAEGTYWERDILFPAEKPLDLRVYVYWNENRFGERRRGIFKCPPLETGKSYKVWFSGNSRGGSIFLTYSSVTGVNLMTGKPNGDIVYEQIIPPPSSSLSPSPSSNRR
jgi:hypothetical protein